MSPATGHRSSKDDADNDKPDEDNADDIEATHETTMPAEKDEEAAIESTENTLHRVDSKPYSVFTHGEKRIIIFCAGVCSFLSPISAQIYFPALNQISASLHVSYDLVNLTITTYLVSRPLSLIGERY